MHYAEHCLGHPGRLREKCADPLLGMSHKKALHSSYCRDQLNRLQDIACGDQSKRVNGLFVHLSRTVRATSLI